MDDNLRLLFWLLGGGFFFGLVGAGFGGLAGAIHWQTGRASGTALALRIARALLPDEDEECPPTRRGALVGAVDGFLFLFVLGIILGALGARAGTTLHTAGMVMLAVLLLTGGALFFGGLAFAFTRSGMPGMAGMFGGATAGGALGYYLAAAGGLLVGVLGGATLGTLGVLAGRRGPNGDQRDQEDEE
jgi:hypothetical protein